MMGNSQRIYNSLKEDTWKLPIIESYHRDIDRSRDREMR